VPIKKPEVHNKQFLDLLKAVAKFPEKNDRKQAKADDNEKAETKEGRGNDDSKVSQQKK
jgi:hypothetical protein